MIDSVEYIAESPSRSSGNFNRSEEIECQLGHFVETNRQFIKKRLSVQYDHFHKQRSSSESTEPIFRRSSVIEINNESSETSVINFSELYSYTGTSWFSAVLIMANCTIGMGLLNFPFAIMNAGGNLVGMFTQMVIIAFIVVSLNMMCYLSQYYGDVSFQGVIGSHLGKVSKEICRILIFLNNFGALIVSLIVIGDQFEHISRAIWAHEEALHWLLDRRVMVPIISIVFIFPLCLLKNFDIFKYTSFLGVIAALYISFGLIFKSYFTLNGSKFVEVKESNLSNLVKIIPLICFTYECHIEIPPMIACLKKQNICYYEKMIFGYVILSSIVYSFAGIFGYLTFGAATPDDILTAYDPKDPYVIVAMVLITLKIVTTYPIVFYCLRIVVEDYVKVFISKFQQRSRCDSLIKYSLTIVLFSSTVLIAIFVQNISTVINLIGGISAVFIFIFPGMCFLKLYSSSPRKWKWSLIILGSLYIALGVFISAVSTAHSIEEYILR
uniref:Slc38a-1 n=1 Tax=Schmidtea mediterranea TaxID=79327 RepID=A0A0H3YFA8_SCHMD|nr:slc38a-1 [Schmidtea mediterranea]